MSTPRWFPQWSFIDGRQILAGITQAVLTPGLSSSCLLTEVQSRARRPAKLRAAMARAVVFSLMAVALILGVTAVNVNLTDKLVDHMKKVSAAQRTAEALSAFR